MKLYYVSNARLPTEKAHGAQIMKACESFVAEGAQLELSIPRRHNRLRGNPHAYYNIISPFPINRLFTLDLIAWGKFGFIIQSVTFALATAWHLRRVRDGIIYGRDEIVLCVLAYIARVPVVWESHDGAWNACARSVARRAALLIVVSDGAKKTYEERGVSASRIAVVRNGVDLSRFDSFASLTRDEARKKLSLPCKVLIALYNGHLHTWKGAGMLARAVAFLPKDARIIFMGGTDPDIEAFRKEHGMDPRIMVIGRKGDQERPVYLRAADAVVLPNTAESEISALFTSPLKLFGYMASGTPIVASDLPSVREVVSDESAYFAIPDDPRSFADRILEVAAHPEQAMAHAHAAGMRVREFDWHERAKRILRLLKNVSLDRSVAATV